MLLLVLFHVINVSCACHLHVIYVSCHGQMCHIILSFHIFNPPSLVQLQTSACCCIHSAAFCRRILLLHGSKYYRRYPRDEEKSPPWGDQNKRLQKIKRKKKVSYFFFSVQVWLRGKNKFPLPKKERKKRMNVIFPFSFLKKGSPNFGLMSCSQRAWFFLYFSAIRQQWGS